MRAFRVVLLLAFLAVTTLLVRAPRPRAAAPRVPSPVPAEAVDPEAPPPASVPDLVPPPAPEEEERVTVEPLLPNLRWLLAHQNPDGSWGDARATLEGVEIDRPGITGLALLCLLNAGYSHLSKEVYEDRCTGVVLRKGLQWLLADQGVDGLFRSSRSTLDHALAAFALADAYGLTGSNLFKEPAHRGIDGLASLQTRDGSWGDRPTTAWAAEALMSAQEADLGVPTSVSGALLAYYDRWRRSDAAEVLARIRFERQRHHPAIAEAVERILAEGPVQSLHQQYFRRRALFQVDGPSGPAWRAWSSSFKESLAARPPLWGAGLSELTIRASLGELSIGYGYAYTNVFRPK